MGTRRQRRLVIWSALAASGVLVLMQVRRRWDHVRPVRALLELAGDHAPGGGGGISKAVQRWVYDRLSDRMDDTATSFLNYGYAPIEPPGQAIDLTDDLESDRYCMQLYDRVARGAELAGAHVLEVGCGRGGGAAFVFERHRLATLVGVDFAESSIDHCRSTHAREGLEFRFGDAEDLPFAGASFDAVINVESSHCYPNIARFFGEVERVLRPGGHLLFADLRGEVQGTGTTTAVDELRRHIEAAGLEIVEEEDITSNVVRSLELDSDRRTALVDRYTPKLIRNQMLDFAGVVGSDTYASFTSRATTYMRVVARKPASVLTTV